MVDKRLSGGKEDGLFFVTIKALPPPAGAIRDNQEALPSELNEQKGIGRHRWYIQKCEMEVSGGTFEKEKKAWTMKREKRKR